MGVVHWLDVVCVAWTGWGVCRERGMEICWRGGGGGGGGADADIAGEEGEDSMLELCSCARVSGFLEKCLGGILLGFAQVLVEV